MDGATLRQRRLAANLGQAALARAVGVSRSTVSHWETDRAAPDVRELAKLEKALAGEQRGRHGKGAARSGVRELDPADPGAAPRAAGVAVLHDAAGKPLWAGKARNLRRKLKRLAAEPWFAQAARATVLAVPRKRMREKVAELARRLAGLQPAQR